MNRMFDIFLSICIGLSVCLVACQSNSVSSDYKVVFKNDKEGKALNGSKSELIQYIRAGASIKIGWGVKGERHSIEHVSEPIWIAVLDEAEVVAHLDPQVLSQTDWTNLSANYADSTLLDQEWRVVVTSNGSFDAVWYDRVKGEVARRRPQSHSITWFAKGEHGITEPLFLH